MSAHTGFPRVYIKEIKPSAEEGFRQLGYGKQRLPGNL